eukprot:5792289-Prymnesium_polylepis.1
MVDRVMSAKTMTRFVKELEKSAPTRNAHRTWRAPRDIVEHYNVSVSPSVFDLRHESGGGFALVLLEAAMRSMGIKLKPV